MLRANKMSERERAIADQVLGKPKIKRNVLKLYNPRDVPFGPLSDNAVHFMRIDNKRWGTVTNYILSNMMIAPTYRNILESASIRGSPKKTNIEDKVKAVIANVEARQRSKLKPDEVEKYRQMILREVAIQKMDIFQLYNYYLGQENFTNVRAAVEKAYNSKVSVDPTMSQTLIDSGNVPIYYISANAQLGTGPDGRGDNIIGTVLMQIRHNLQIQAKEEQLEREKIEEEDRIFDIYKAYYILRNELRDGNDLGKYIGMGSKEIVATWKQLNPGEDLESIGLFEETKPMILQMYRKGQFKMFDQEISRPGSLVLLLRRGERTGDKFYGGLRELRTNVENKRATIILELYTAYMINKEYPQMSKEQQQEAAKQLLTSSPSSRDYLVLRDRVVTLYNQGAFSDQLNEDIEHALKKYPIPSAKEIEEAEEMRSSRSASQEEPEQSSNKTTDSTDENNPLKQLLSSDDKSRKRFLIQRIQSYTGKASSHYKKYNIKDLEKKLANYEPTERGKIPKKQPKKSAGHWEIWVTHRRPLKGIGRREKLVEIHGSKPTKKTRVELIEDYNQKGGVQITVGQTSVRWVPVHVSRSQSEEEEEVVSGFVKPVGKPIEIRAPLDQNPKEWRDFSPIAEKIFSVDHRDYPSVSIYITTMLITHTGVKTDLRSKKGTYFRGTPISIARGLLMAAGRENEFDAGMSRPAKISDFVSPDRANAIYQHRRSESFKELMATFCSIAQKAKFQDRNLQNLLLLTGNMKIIWDDRSDLFLGSGTKNMPGENFAGKNLEKIRTEIEEARKNESFPILNMEDIRRFLMKDKFMETWLRMRLSDMCTTVWRMKHYLWKTDKQDEEIDARFTTHVLDIVYQPCSALTAFSQEIKIPVPRKFVHLVMGCKGMNIKLSKNFNQEMKQIDEERSKLDDAFWNLREQKHEEEEHEIIDPFRLVEEQAKEYREAEKKGVSENQLKELLQRQRHHMEMIIEALNRPQRDNAHPGKFLSSMRQRTDEFSRKQQKRWKKGMDKIMASELDEQEISEKLDEMREKHLESLKKKRFVSDEDKNKFQKKQQREILDYGKRLRRPKFDVKERHEMMEQLRNKLDNAYKKHYGIREGNRTAEEIARHKEQLKEINERKGVLNAQMKKEIAHYQIIMADIAQIYWDRLIVMIYFLIQHINNANQQDVRKVIASIEMLNSQKVSCEGLNSNLDDERDNCIASALANLLVGIEAFKYQYGEHIPLGKHDINLAASIILNRDISESKVEELAPEFEDTEAGKEEIKFTEDFADMQDVSASSFEDYGNEPDSGSFGMTAPNPVDEVERVKIILREITQKDISDLDEIARYFLGMVNMIKTAKMSLHVKTNRINFFATIR